MIESNSYWLLFFIKRVDFNFVKVPLSRLLEGNVSCHFDSNTNLLPIQTVSVIYLMISLVKPIIFIMCNSTDKDYLQAWGKVKQIGGVVQ